MSQDYSRLRDLLRVGHSDALQTPPHALQPLLPLTALEGQKRQALYRQHGLELILLDRRVHFETPSGKQGGSWFATAWFCGYMHIGQQITFAHLDWES